MRMKWLVLTSAILLILVLSTDAKILGGTNVSYQLDHIVIHRAVRIELCPTDMLQESGAAVGQFGGVGSIQGLPCGSRPEEVVIGEVSTFIRESMSPMPPSESTWFLVLFRGQIYRECRATYDYYKEKLPNLFWNFSGEVFAKAPSLKHLYGVTICRVDPRLPYGDEEMTNSSWLLHNRLDGGLDFYLRLRGESWRLAAIKNQVANLTFGAAEVLRYF